MGRLPDSILVHVAVPLSYLEPDDLSGQWVEGEPGSRGGGLATFGAPFVCVLFVPSAGGAQDNAFRPKQIRAPTLLCNPLRDTGFFSTDGIPTVTADSSPIVFGPEDELMVYAPELASWVGGSPARFQINGTPQPFGPPGLVYGIQTSLRQVAD